MSSAERVPQIPVGRLLLDGAGLTRLAPSERCEVSLGPTRGAEQGTTLLLACDATHLYIGGRSVADSPADQLILRFRVGERESDWSVRLRPYCAVYRLEGGRHHHEPDVVFRTHRNRWELAIPRVVLQIADPAPTTVVLSVDYRPPDDTSRSFHLDVPSPDGPQHGCLYTTAGRRHVRGAAEVFAQAFPESMQHVLGRRAPQNLLDQLFLLLFRADPDAFLVALRDGVVVGYVVAPERLDRIWRKGLRGGYVCRLLWQWVRGRFKLGWAPVMTVLRNKFQFLRGAVRDRHAVPARILSIGVAPEQQGGGIGKALVRHAMERFQRLGVKRVRLEVRPGNVAARRLYEAWGFEVVGSTKDSQGEWLIMTTPPDAASPAEDPPASSTE